eukprot:TRINITY_DN31097_c0_g1_i1.p3 TRINITY_DN31097_c0_g1~~TRINITY_DN31097_c0_g1_i1.p3  ORF type:complete len:120 (+),score=41.91 TRINITY_DN31097_c0_g1_i1:96-455(+)
MALHPCRLSWPWALTFVLAGSHVAAAAAPGGDVARADFLQAERPPTQEEKYFAVKLHLAGSTREAHQNADKAEAGAEASRKLVEEFDAGAAADALKNMFFTAAPAGAPGPAPAPAAAAL